MAEHEHYDIVIAGGGMVGASLACALAPLPLRIAIVEAVPVESDTQPSFDVRTTALSRSSQRILSGLGVWPGVEPFATPIRRIHVSEQGRFGTALIDATEQGVEALGYVLENRRLGPALWAKLQAAGNVDLLCPARCEQAVVADTSVELSVAETDEIRKLTASLLVVADGARSKLRAALGIADSSRSYQQVAIIGTVEVSRPGRGDSAWERFTPAGPLALLPAGEDRYVFVLTRAEAQADAVRALDDDDFRDLLQAGFGFRLGRFGRVGSRYAYPLALVRSAAITGPRAAIVGNAAHSLHPVAGQGYNLGLRDAAVLAEVIADELAAGRQDVGQAELLQRYRHWRQADQRNVVAFTDGLVRLFNLPAGALGLARGLSLGLFDVVPGAKTALARQTMGLGGRQTRLARGLAL